MMDCQVCCFFISLKYLLIYCSCTLVVAGAFFGANDFGGSVIRRHPFGIFQRIVRCSASHAQRVVMIEDLKVVNRYRKTLL